jgi:hypothetical protein
MSIYDFKVDSGGDIHGLFEDTVPGVTLKLGKTMKNPSQDSQ